MNVRAFTLYSPDELLSGKKFFSFLFSPRPSCIHWFSGGLARYTHKVSAHALSRVSYKLYYTIPLRDTRVRYETLYVRSFPGYPQASLLQERYRVYIYKRKKRKKKWLGDKSIFLLSVAEHFFCMFGVIDILFIHCSSMKERGKNKLAFESMHSPPVVRVTDTQDIVSTLPRQK